MSKFLKTMLVLGVVAVIAFLFFAGAIIGAMARLAEGGMPVREKRPHITELKVEGPIMGSQLYLESIARIAQDPACKGVLLRIDSPGGAVGASQEIYSAVKALKGKHIPVVVTQGNVAASGGYYVSLAGDRIFSNAGTLTGSIGVIFQFPGAEKLMNKIGINLWTVKSGPLKDVGNLARAPTPEELRYLQGVIDNVFEQFVGDVLANRKVERAALLKIADGRIMTGEQAKQHGLVDTLGGYQEAKAYLTSLAKLEGEPVVVQEPPKKHWLESMVESRAPSSLGSLSRAAQGLLPVMGEGAYYLWK